MPVFYAFRALRPDPLQGTTPGEWPLHTQIAWAKGGAPTASSGPSKAKLLGCVGGHLLLLGCSQGWTGLDLEELGAPQHDPFFQLALSDSREPGRLYCTRLLGSLGGVKWGLEGHGAPILFCM